MIRAYLLLGVTALFGNGVTLAPIIEQYHRTAQVAPPPRAPTATMEIGSTTRSPDGLFRMTGMIDGRPVIFVVDTGATVTVLSRQDAARAGLAAAPGDATGSLTTASGTTRMAWKRVDALMVAGARITDLDVAIGGEGVVRSLLGQDVLSQVGVITISGDRLEVRPAAA